MLEIFAQNEDVVEIVLSNTGSVFSKEQQTTLKSSSADGCTSMKQLRAFLQRALYLEEIELERASWQRVREEGSGTR